MSWIFPRDSVQVPSGLTGTKFHPAKWTEERETLAVCPLHPHLCSEQVMPSPERVQKTRVDNQGTEQGRQKESSNHHHHAHNQDLPDSSETQLPRDAQHVMAPGPQPELSLEAVGENPTWIAVEDHKALGRRNNPRVNWNPDHWLRRYNYMDIYICIYIYIYVMYKRLSYQVPLNQLFKSTGSSSRDTCRRAGSASGVWTQEQKGEMRPRLHDVHSPSDVMKTENCCSSK